MVNQIAIARETRGTETSKYPEEKKETSIPKVAASEMGRAQTILRYGVVDRSSLEVSIVKAVWKDQPQRVIAP